MRWPQWRSTARSGAVVQLDEEIDSKRLDRELNELLQEIRVAQGGILILVGFLLVIPFTQRFADVSNFQRDVYYLTLLAAGSAAILIMAPVSHHRLAFRRRDKLRLVERGNIAVIAGLAMLAVAVLGVLLLITDFLFSTTLAIIMSTVYATLVSLLWYVLPLHSRRRAAQIDR